MFIFRKNFGKLEFLAIFTPVRLPNGTVCAVIGNSGIWTNVLLPSGEMGRIDRGTVVEVLASNSDIAIAGLLQLEKELKNETTA
jgi:hypothetical protein